MWLLLLFRCCVVVVCCCCCFAVVVVVLLLCLLLCLLDNHETMEASERDQQASEWDQYRILARDQMYVVSAMRDQNNEKACDASMAWDQNNENDYEGNMHFEGTKEKQMTYREALLGLDNYELSSDF